MDTPILPFLKSLLENLTLSNTWQLELELEYSNPLPRIFMIQKFKIHDSQPYYCEGLTDLKSPLANQSTGVFNATYDFHRNSS